MKEKGWSTVTTAERAGLPMATVKNIIYGKNAVQKIGTLEKLAKAFDCTIDSLVSDASIEEKSNEKLDVELFKECLDVVEDFCVRKGVVCDKGKMMKVVESLTSLYAKKKVKGEIYLIDDDTVEWVMGNIR